MADPIDNLQALVSKELERVSTSIISLGYINTSIIELCKAFDFYHSFLYFFASDKKRVDSDEFYRTARSSYPTLLKLCYDNITFQFGFPIMTSKEAGIADLLDKVTSYVGKLVEAQQLIDQVRSGLTNITQRNPDEFVINQIYKESGLEYLENLRYQEYLEKKELSLEKLKKKHLKKQDKVYKAMFRLVQPGSNYFIKYDTTPEIDDYFSKWGRYAMLEKQPYDLFEKNALFGGIEFDKYIRVLTDLIGTGIKHVVYCSLLCEKRSDINLRDIICIPYLIQDLIPQYSEYLNLEDKEVEQIFDCLTVTPENIDYHIKDQKSFSPTFIKVSKTHIMRSVYGPMNKPLMFLTRELKRRYPNDYHKNTERESLFRNELYSLLKETSRQKENFLFVESEININSGKVKTDIDAAIYDVQTRSLALFQLKWQELFAHDLKERRNRLTNYSQKAEEWVNKMNQWLALNDSATVLNALKLSSNIAKKDLEISETFLFVINRFNAHFTGFYPSDKAAWASWYSFIESANGVSSESINFLEDLYLKIKLNSPTNKPLPDRSDFMLECSEFKILFV